MNRKHLIALACAVGVTAIAIPTALAGGPAKTVCPSGGTPAAGSTVKGGLEVDGTCILNNVTVNGPITVDSTGHLQFYNGSVAHGGITVNPGGELDVNATTNGTGVPTGGTSTINGGINFDGGTSGRSDADIWTATIHGGISFTGQFPFIPFVGFNQPTFCGNDISGTVTFNNVSSFGPVFFGDPDVGCPGNTIHGSLSLTNTASTNRQDEFESNTISGSVFLNASTTQLNGNTIGGNVNCSNGAVILPGEALDPASNTCS
jgi:hypothetical protein